MLKLYSAVSPKSYLFFLNKHLLDIGTKNKYLCKSVYNFDNYDTRTS